MKIRLDMNAYGKHAVNLSKIIRHPGYHEFRQVTVDVQLRGDFEDAHVSGDNSKILPTDTQKNSIYVLAKDHFRAGIEDFGLVVADHFSRNNPQVTQVTVTLAEHRYTRMVFDGVPHPHAFTGNGPDKNISRVEQTGRGVQVTSGITDLLILKTTDSAFEDYIVDRYTTLPPAADRILATQCEVSWTYAGPIPDYTVQRASIRETLLNAFAFHKSRSVQHTLYAMGEAVLEQHAGVDRITLTMPNKHHIPFNLGQFGLANDNEIFMATDHPYGLITATLVRETGAPTSP